MGQWTQEAALQFRNARRNLENDRLNAALDEATQAYAAFQLSGDLEGMAECVRIVSHALSRQGLRKQAVQMATEELENFRAKNQKRAEAMMLLSLAEIKLNHAEKDAREEACHLANQAKLVFSNLKDRKMEGESCLAHGNALLKSGAAGSNEQAIEVFQQAREIFRSLQSLALEGRALHGRACCSAAGGSFAGAVNEANEALSCFEQCRNETLQLAVLEAISGWHLESGELLLARNFAEQSLALGQQISCSPAREASCLRTLVRVYIQQGTSSSVLGNCLDAVERFRSMNAREAESIALCALVECSMASQDTLDRSLQAATDACLAFRELGDTHQEMEMCCTMTRLCLEHQQFDQAEDHARTALHLAKIVDDRLAQGEALGLLAEVFLLKPGGAEKAVSLLKKEHLSCQDSGDELGEALCLLSLAHAYMELSKPKEVLSSADAARKLFRSLGDKMGELSALQITADVHARAMRYSEMSQALEKALSLAEVLGDNVTEASLQISFAQAQMGLLEVSSAAPGTDTFRDLGNSAAKAAKKAVALARRQQRSDLVISALCALSQTQFLVGEKQAARSAAKAAVSLAKGQPLSQANALVLTANSCITLGKMQAAKEAAGNALYLFEEVKDYVGQDLAKATLDAIDNPVSAVSTTGKMRLVRKKKSSVNADALRQKVRNVVSEIVGMDALQDDTPLMQSGLTSQSAVLLRNALSTGIPGSSLPFTLMFDYPSISDLSAFFVESAGGEEEEVEEWVEDPSAGRQVAQARSGPNPDELKKQVRDVVAEIVGMDDLVDDTPLMQAGLTSQSAVLLRNSLSKELPGASLPFTMMFDYPSINALTDFFVARSGPIEEEGPMIIYEDEAAGAKGSSSLDPQVTQRQVRHIVEEIVGMDDFTDAAMTILPSIMSTATLAQGHVYHTTSMPPRSRTLSPSSLPRDPSLMESTRSRTRTEWLRSDFQKESGEIRNIQVLGIIREHLVIASQRSGRVRVFVNNEHSLELPETNRMHNTSPFGIDWTKKYRKYLHNSRAMRFAEFEIRSLPMQVLVIGETETSEAKLIPATKPIMEARTVAKILVSGYVEKQRHFPSNLGAPGHPYGLSWSGALGNVSLAEGTGRLQQHIEKKLPPSTAAMSYQKLNASQKSFLGIDKKGC